MSEERGFKGLLDALTEHGFEIVHIGPESAGDIHEAVIRSREYEHTYVLTSFGAWVQAMQMLFEAAELDASPHRSQVLDLALRLHSRFLGCRFGLDEDRNLAVQYDIYPDMTADHVSTALGQLYYVGSSAHQLFEEALKGVVIDETRIEHAFDAENRDDLS